MWKISRPGCAPTPSCAREGFPEAPRLASAPPAPPSAQAGSCVQNHRGVQGLGCDARLAPRLPGDLFVADLTRAQLGLLPRAAAPARHQSSRDWVPIIVGCHGGQGPFLALRVAVQGCAVQDVCGPPRPPLLVPLPFQPPRGLCGASKAYTPGHQSCSDWLLDLGLSDLSWFSLPESSAE